MSGPRPLAVYLRVSTADQSHDSQRAELDRWLAREAADPSRVAWYEDTESGKVSSRPAFNRLKADIRAGKRRTVVVYALDRLSRDFFDGVSLLGDWLRAGVRVASATEALDLSGEIGQALAGVIFALAQAERRKLLERQKCGIEVARARGVYTGRVKGSTKGKPAEAVALKARGLTDAQVARSLGVSVSTARRYLSQGPRP